MDLLLKKTFSHYSGSEHKIAVVSGMHPHEELSTEVLSSVVKMYAFFNNVEIVNYQVTVEDNPEDFYKSRANGESLVHDYVVKDIAKEDFDLVIIGHDHEEGYGERFYIVTPSMDSKLVELGDKVMKQVPEFNYYKRNKSQSAKSSSITTVDDPIITTGTPLFVYEIFEWLDFSEAFSKSHDLISASHELLN
ncbi:hypothetical protein ALNOE001_00810 [Candidatus Methanobinarius endosymbioticus]|uniref:Uncharacterized protein n=1 Tax=Candidatus Methanobinarius endosymbioticus TaxID=2006182 RepID=A0A366MG03_9EURY|nr:hypothetical protein ALNOE001_00810 [Candidatus Methanobinarius endosymbioticus]